MNHGFARESKKWIQLFTKSFFPKLKEKHRVRGFEKSESAFLQVLKEIQTNFGRRVDFARLSQLY